MSTPEQPLTRRQLKELRRTGQLPTVDEDQTDDTAAPQEEQADPVAGDEHAFDADASADAGEGVPAAEAEPEPEEEPKPLTRREMRMHRLRTSQIDVVESEHAVDAAPAVADREADAEGTSDAEHVASPTVPVADSEAATAEPLVAETAAEDADEAKLPVGFEDSQHENPATGSQDAADDERPQVGASFGAAVFRQAEERQRAEREQAEREAVERREAKEREDAHAGETETAPDDEATQAPNETAASGSDTSELAAEAFQRSLESSGSTSGNASALILKDMPGTAALNAPITATGELILTSSHSLPEGIGTHGAAKGTTDGRDVDDVLIDGEIPQHSSPTPISASSAVSTSKSPGEVIRPPAPEKNHGLMLTLGITAGVLGVALIGVVVYVFATGALN
ncbi:hypothetical protein [Microbacterium halotolerans]|uniref:hypothetical protein n=1 Tax=Microbacterium halotolerans TaxID=246613 RepID=UPI000E6AA186|nr:hypothetical protein [Microbacterium halotolerans]